MQNKCNCFLFLWEAYYTIYLVPRPVFDHGLVAFLFFFHFQTIFRSFSDFSLFCSTVFWPFLWAGKKHFSENATRLISLDFSRVIFLSYRTTKIDFFDLCRHFSTANVGFTFIGCFYIQPNLYFSLNRLLPTGMFVINVCI